jgi:hypothetical protein
MIDLDRPLGDRRLIVNGTTWGQLDSACPYGTLGNPDMNIGHIDCDPVQTP